MKLQYANTEQTSAIWTDSAGVHWHGISIKNNEVQSDGQIPNQAKKWLADGNTIEPYVEPPKPFASLSRPAFLFMAKKLGLDDAVIKGLIASMPSSTPEEVDARDLALIVYENQQSFERDNALLKTLVAKSSITEKQIDAAWRTGEKIKW